MNRHLTKEDTGMVKYYLKTYSTSLIINDLHSKTTMRYHFIPIKWLLEQQQQNPQNITTVGVDVERLEFLYAAHGNVK